MRAATRYQASRRFQGAADRHQMGDAVSPKRRTGWYGDPVFGRIRRPPARRVAVFGRGEGLVACCQHQQGRCGDRHPGDARRGGVPDAVLVLWLLTLDGRCGVDHLFELGGRAFARGRRRSFRCGAGRLPLPGLKRRSAAVRQGRRRQAISGELRNPAAVAHIAGVNDTRAGIAFTAARKSQQKRRTAGCAAVLAGKPPASPAARSGTAWRCTCAPRTARPPVQAIEIGPNPPWRNRWTPVAADGRSTLLSDSLTARGEATAAANLIRGLSVPLRPGASAG